MGIDIAAMKLWTNEDFVAAGYNKNQMDALRVLTIDPTLFTEDVEFIAQLNPTTNEPVYSAGQMHELKWAFTDPTLFTEDVHFIAQLNPETHEPVYNWDQMQQLRYAFKNPKLSTEDVEFLGTINPETHEPVFSAYQMEELRYAFENDLSPDQMRFITTIDPERGFPVFNRAQMEQIRTFFQIGKTIEDIKNGFPLIARELNRLENIANSAQEEVTEAPSLRSEGRDAQAASKELNVVQSAPPARATERN